jgi:hypothetical protein
MNQGPAGWGQNAGNQAPQMPVSVDWTMPNGSSFAYVSPYYNYPFAPPYIPTVNGN